MTTYSDWIIIPADRKCDLPRDARVQPMRYDQNVLEARGNTENYACYYLEDDDETWRSVYFAYRVVQEPVEEQNADFAEMNFLPDGSVCIWPSEGDSSVFSGTPNLTLRDGRPYRFEWRQAND